MIRRWAICWSIKHLYSLAWLVLLFGVFALAIFLSGLWLISSIDDRHLIGRLEIMAMTAITLIGAGGVFLFGDRLVDWWHSWIIQHESAYDCRCDEARMEDAL